MSHKNIILYGVPGSGKTLLARALSDRFKIPHLETDEVRKIGKLNKTPEADPFFFLSTTEAYKALGSHTHDNIIKGLIGVRQAYRDLVKQEITTYKNGCVAEAAFLDPASLKDEGVIVLIITSSEEKHQRQFFEHRTNDTFNNSQFENTRIIQDFFIEEARQLNIPIIQNEGDITLLVEKIVKLLV